MIKMFLKFVNLHNGEEDKKKVVENVTSNISFRGSNLWILACAIIIASVGLNVNSTAVIIGAMLISPLMGPILGAGLALGTYNFALLKKSIKNLLIATIVSLIVSTLYFFLSPFKEVQSELLSRTSPTIYDVLIAFFGGLVGVIAITRVEKGNPIPGVAIATALMPPLCTAGYGLATYNFQYFFGAFYLYTINCFFICIATFLVIKYLKYPAATSIDARYEKRIRNGISALIVLMIIPSFYLAYNLWNEKAFAKNADAFINSEFNAQGFTVIYKKVNYQSTPHTIDLAFLDKKLTKKEIDQYNAMLKQFNLSNTVLNIKQNDDDLKAEILNEINQNENTLSEKDYTISNLRQELNQYQVNEPSLTEEIKVLFPEVKNIMLGKIEEFPNTDSTKLKCLILYHMKEGNGRAELLEEEKTEEKLRAWLKQRLSGQDVLLVRDHNPIAVDTAK